MTNRHELFELLLHLAGRVPDDGLATMRTALADGETAEVAGMLVTAAGTGELALTGDESRLIRALAVEHGIAATEVARAPRFSSPARYRFLGDSTMDCDSVDDAVIRAAGKVGGLGALWRGQRVSGRAVVRVYLGEAVPGADVAELTAEIQHCLVASGHAPCAEVFAEGAELAHYHEAALRDAALVWTASPHPAVHLARVFDGTDPDGRPFFRPNHPKLAGAERDRLLSFLRAGEVVLGSAGLTDDVVDPGRTDAVELNFRSDGTWIWNDAVIYYLDVHSLDPDPDLVSHVQHAAAAPRRLSRLGRHRVLRALSAPTSQQRAEQR